MSKEKIYSLMNEAFELMIGNRLREDMDDTLLDKLLGLIQENCKTSEKYFSTFEEKDVIKSLLQNTIILKLAEQTVISLTEVNVMSPATTVFSLKLIGIILKQEEIFSLHTLSQLLNELSKAIRYPGKLAPSVQDGILNCLLPIATHSSGALWIIEKNLLNFVFKSFSCTSYYVRKTASNILGTVLCMWSTKFTDMPIEKHTILMAAIEDIISETLKGAQLSGSVSNSSISDCCFSVLTQCAHVNIIRNRVEPSHLLKCSLENFSCDMGDDKKCSNMMSLLTLLSDNEGTESFVKTVIQHLVEGAQFLKAFQVASAFLQGANKYKPFTCNHLYFNLMPISVLSNKPEEEKVFLQDPTKAYLSLSRIMEVKPDCIKLLSSCLIFLSKLVHSMSPEAVNVVTKAIEIIVKGPCSDTHHPMAHICLENRSIILALLELFQSMLAVASEKCDSAAMLCDITVFEYLLCFLDRPSLDSNIVSKVLQLIGRSLSQSYVVSIGFPDSVKERFLQLLSRKILDKKESVVDEAIHVSGILLCEAGNEIWQIHILKHNIHAIIWEIAVVGSHEGFIKASALEVIVKACLNATYWEDLKLQKQVDEMELMQLFCNLYDDPDYYIQRESVKCLYKWISAKMEYLPPSCKENVFAILSDSSRSLDLELKIIALKYWDEISNSNSYISFNSSNIEEFLESLCSSGFTSSLMSAIDDYDEAIKFKATSIMSKLRERLIALGFSKSSLSLQEVDEETIVSQSFEQSLSIEPVSKEEKRIGLDDVMNLSTAEQISSISKPYIVKSKSSVKNDCLSANSEFSSVKYFWERLWCEKSYNILSSDPLPTCIFSEYTVSLLEDILAAEEAKVFHPEDETRDCY